MLSIACCIWRLPRVPLFHIYARKFAEPITSSFRNFAAGTIAPIPVDRIRNVAVVAHVDHGKTTLVDSLLRSCGCRVENTRLLDQGDLEKEKAPIRHPQAKSTRLEYDGFTLNVIDTPGHADFGGEVERVLSMVDGVILLVDLHEGPRPQSRFVLAKALKNPDLVPLVVINKADKPSERQKGEIENEIFELFLNVGASEYQMEYTTLYGSAKYGWMEECLEEARQKEHPKGIWPLLNAVIRCIPSPVSRLKRLQNEKRIPTPSVEDADGVSLRKPVTTDFTMLVNLVERSPQWNVTVTGTVTSGMAVRDAAVYLRSSETNETVRTKIREILVTKGVDKVPFLIASPGDIVTLQLSANTTPAVYDTVSGSPETPALPFLPIDSPLLGVDVCPNSSPLQGEDGSLSSLNDLKMRLKKEALVNLAIKTSDNSLGTGITVRGRGNLQLGILLETMRREGYEFEVTSPQVLLTRSSHGKLLEPWELYTFIGSTNYAAAIIEEMSERNADFIKQEIAGDDCILIFECATRLFFGMSNWLNEIAKGTVTFTSEQLDARPYLASTKKKRACAVVATATGHVSSIELSKFQSSCRFFVSANEKVYEGAIVGYTNKQEELHCNIARMKKLVVVRVASKEVKEAIAQPIKTSIEYCIAFIQDDEVVEVTPKRLCMRKKILNGTERIKAQKQSLKAMV